MADCFLAGAVATGCDYTIEQTEPPYDELAPDKWLAEIFRGEMNRLGREPGRRGDRGRRAAGQHRHGQRHAGDAGHPPGRRRRRGRRIGASAGLRRRRRESQRRQGRRRRRDHAGAHGGRPGRDARRARPGARAACRGGRRHETGRSRGRLAGRSLRRLGGLAQAHARPPRTGAPGVRHHSVRRVASGRRRAEPEGAARRNGPDLRFRP